MIRFCIDCSCRKYSNVLFKIICIIFVILQDKTLNLWPKEVKLMSKKKKCTHLRFIVGSKRQRLPVWLYQMPWSITWSLHRRCDGGAAGWTRWPRMRKLQNKTETRWTCCPPSEAALGWPWPGLSVLAARHPGEEIMQQRVKSKHGRLSLINLPTVPFCCRSLQRQSDLSAPICSLIFWGTCWPITNDRLWINTNSDDLLTLATSGIK